MTQLANNKLIAKNTLMLYMRMLLITAVSLYTSRVVLATLGVEDYGIYNLVGGVVALFSFLNAAMSSATQRSLSFELGREDTEQVRRVFSMSLTVHFCIAALVLLLTETIGLWFLNAKLNIPDTRMAVSNWVYQFSIVSIVLGIVRVPYDAMIIAHERMSLYVYIGIIEVLLKLGLVLLLVLATLDKLILFAGLVMGVSVVTLVICIWFCRRIFESAGYSFILDKKLFSDLASFSGWSLVGSFSHIANTQGLNIVMNIFFGVTVNAAMGIANQVNGTIYQFVTNFQMAFNPQIVKYYAGGQKEELNLLVFRAAKFSFLLMLFLALPVIVNVDFVLSLWLTVVPDYASGFVCLALGYCLVDSLSSPIYSLVNATGNIRGYQVIIGFFLLLNVPLAYYFLSLGLSPIWVLASRVGISFLMLPARFFIAKKSADFLVRRFLVDVIAKIVGISLIAVIPSIFIAETLSGWNAFLSSSVYSCLAVFVGSWFLGLHKAEQRAVVEMFKQKLMAK